MIKHLTSLILLSEDHRLFIYVYTFELARFRSEILLTVRDLSAAYFNSHGSCNKA